VTTYATRPGADRLLAAVRRNLVWIPLLVVLGWTLIPLLWSLSASLKTPLELYQSSSLLPRDATLDSYRRVFEWPGFWRFLFNSTLLALTSTALALVISSLAAYGFARYAFRFRNLLLVLILVPRILPRASLIVPLYQLVERFGLLDTYAVLIITYTATAVPFATWILAGFFAAVPVELEEAAAIDGASIPQRLWWVVLPIAVPGLITAAVFSLREAWNEFPFALAFTTSMDMRTLPYQLFLLRDSVGIQDWPLMNAFTIVTILPILFLYLRFERYIVSGLTSGALK
jgi:ABC-type glycerol-3-phosphate transport system permease component